MLSPWHWVFLLGEARREGPQLSPGSGADREVLAKVGRWRSTKTIEMLFLMTYVLVPAYVTTLWCLFFAGAWALEAVEKEACRASKGWKRGQSPSGLSLGVAVYAQRFLKTSFKLSSFPRRQAPNKGAGMLILVGWRFLATATLWSPFGAFSWVLFVYPAKLVEW